MANVSPEYLDALHFAWVNQLPMPIVDSFVLKGWPLPRCLIDMIDTDYEWSHTIGAPPAPLGFLTKVNVRVEFHVINP